MKQAQNENENANGAAITRYTKQFVTLNMDIAVLTTVLTAPGLCILTPFTA